MATLAVEPGSALHQEPLADFILVRTDEVDQGERIRPVDHAWAEVLGQMMVRDGQDTPITVCRLPGRSRWLLVAGGHRLAGALSAGIEHLRAEIVSADRDDRKLREVRENVMRSELAPIDRAAHIAEAVAILKRRAGLEPHVDGRAASAAARWQKALKDEADDANDTMSFAYGWSEDVADQIGLNKRTIERDLMLYRRLAPSLVERLRAARHPILTNGTQLRTLAKLDERDQSKVVSLLTQPGASLNYGKPKTVADAIAHPLGPKPAEPKPAPGDKRYNTILGTLQRMTPVELTGLFQSPQFHGLIPAQARALLAPMLRDGQPPQEENGDAVVVPGDRDRAALGVAGHGGAHGSARPDPVGEHSDRFQLGQGEPVQSVAMASRPPVLGSPAEGTERSELKPAVPIRASVKPEYLVCLECGEKHEMLKRHLRTHDLTSADYLTKWRLPLDYPFIAPVTADRRHAQAKKLGLAK